MERILQYLSHYKIFIYPFLSLISFAESFAFIGLLVPGAMFIATAGILCSLHILNFYYTMVWCSIGAIFGDILSFHLAMIFDKKIVNSKFFKKNINKFEKGKDFFNKYGGVSVFIGRFIGMLRPIIPFVAGMVKMDIKKFYFYAITSGILWGILYPAAGYFLGRNWKIIQKYITEISIILLTFILIYFFYRKRKNEL